MAEKQILLSMNDSKIKEIAEILGNKTCMKILDSLAESRDAKSSGDISKLLKMPLNTADYNVKKLVNAGLIEQESHFWSVKGKKIPVYKISNRKIIIEPKKTSQNLKALFLSVLATGAAGLVLNNIIKNQEAGFAAKSAVSGTENAVYSSLQTTSATSSSVYSFLSNIPEWTWFIAGAVFFLAAFLIIKKITERRV